MGLGGVRRDETGRGKFRYVMVWQNRRRDGYGKARHGMIRSGQAWHGEVC